MIGFPGETVEDIRMTGLLAHDIFSVNPEMISTNVYCVTPFPGSKLYSRCQDTQQLSPARTDWKKNPEMYTYDHAQIGTDPNHLQAVEAERNKIIMRSNRKEVSGFLVGGQSWETKR